MIFTLQRSLVSQTPRSAFLQVKNTLNFVIYLLYSVFTKHGLSFVYIKKVLF
jgi:hypothetical protein